MNLSEMRELLGARDIQLTKSLGQNFLHDQNQLRRIVAAAELTRADKVLEIDRHSIMAIAGVPAITIASVITGAFLVFNLYEWAKDPTYGVNNPQSFILMGSMYVLAIAIYIAASIIRSRQGIDLRKIHEAIPVE